MPKPVQASTYTFRHLIDGGFLYVDKTRAISMIPCALGRDSTFWRARDALARA